ncbi:MAG: hypothetical protein JJ925_09060 [Parvibaculum sp.]|uniref:hypothetical protein n=1 Tax=Parvibaculum sp. TaxID=2024848 RepID=UPI001B2F7D59|nr:hypothetical protein [Parvibaculum sp.]MBO6685059.1 hypothetical protein [Parvibaculum sp.]
MPRAENDIGIALRRDPEAAGNAHAAKQPEAAAKPGGNILLVRAGAKALLHAAGSAQDCSP